jgi:hypothetical protein
MRNERRFKVKSSDFCVQLGVVNGQSTSVLGKQIHSIFTAEEQAKQLQNLLVK